jgi:septation ring formation regulator EzrA
VTESSDLRQFIHEITLRMERSLMAQIEEGRKRAEKWDAHFERIHEEHDRQWAELQDIRDEDRAQREALLRILDRLDGGEGAQPAT